jgi:hypothetical protein
VQQVGEVDRKIYFDFGVRKDSDSLIRRLPMTERSVILDSVSYAVPADLADKISRLHDDAAESKVKEEKAEAKAEQAVKKAGELETAVEEAEEEAKNAEDRADAAIEILESANTTLKSLGYTVNRDGEYVKDMHSAPQSHATPGAAAGEEQEDGHQEFPMKAKAKKEDSLEERLDAWVAAEVLVPGLRATKFDKALDVPGIKRLTIEALKPGLQFDDAEVPGLHRALTEGLGQRADHSSRHADALEAAVRTSNAAAASTRQDTVNNVPEVDKSYLEPLALSSK